MRTSTKNIKMNKVGFGTILNYTFITIVVAICLYPFLNVLAVSLSGNRPILSGEVTFYPKEIQLNSYKQILSKTIIWDSMFTTVLITLLGTGLGLILTIFAAYPLSKKNLKGRAVITGFILFTMYFSGGIIPTFLLVKGIGMYDSLAALFIPSAMNVFNFILMRTFFSNLPDSLEEAAKLDGCSDINLLMRIVLPLSKPIIATIGLFYAVGYWNEYFSALMYIQSPEKYTLQLRLRQLLFSEELNQLNNNVEAIGSQVMPESLKMASIIVATLPIILVYPWIQKYFVKGVMLGSVKG